MFGGWEMILILALLLLLFGGKRFPDLARNLGKGMREFRRATSGVHEEKPPIEELKDESSKE